jgi:tetratricopeptide (TPR) repeat protein
VISSRDNKDLATLFYGVNKLAQSYPRSPYVKDGLGIAIDTALRIGQYRVLADYLENFTGKFPADPQAPDLLLQAARIREGLGQYAASNRDYRRFLSMGKASQQQLDDAVFSMFENARNLENTNATEKILTGYAGKLSALPGLRADAELAVLNYQANRRSQASRLSKRVKKAYQPKMGEKAPELRDEVAELYYYEVYLSSGPYFKLRLKNKIDNAMVSRKTQLLQKLEEGYQKVMAAKSPDWALKACFRANELNREFAEFLTRSPLPEGLNAEQSQQYQHLIREKARAYQDKADQYVKTCIELARRWEICDPRLASYFTPAAHPQGSDGRYDSLAAGKSSTEISLQALKDQRLLPIYQKMIGGSEEPANHLALARAYLKQGDYRQAFLVAQNGLTKLKSGQDGLRVDLLNLIGVTYLYCGQDRQAKEAFKKALGSNPSSSAARINLAGLYHHYGHHDKARELVRGLSAGQVHREDVHPRTGALYNEYGMQTN